MGKVKEYKVVNWKKSEYKKKSIESDTGFDISVRKYYKKYDDLEDVPENNVLEVCEVIIKQRYKYNEDDYSFKLLIKESFDTIIQPDNKWLKTNDSYSWVDKEDEERYDENSELELEIMRGSLNHDTTYTSNVWESYELNQYNSPILSTRKQYPKWEPFNIVIRRNLMEGVDHCPLIYIELHFINEQYMIDYFIKGEPNPGRDRFTEQERLELLIPEDERKEDYYKFYFLKKITNTKTKKVVKTFYLRYEDVKGFIIKKVKPQPQAPKEEKLFDYVDLWGDIK